MAGNNLNQNKNPEKSKFNPAQQNAAQAQQAPGAQSAAKDQDEENEDMKLSANEDADEEEDMELSADEDSEEGDDEQDDSDLTDDTDTQHNRTKH